MSLFNFKKKKDEPKKTAVKVEKKSAAPRTPSSAGLRAEVLVRPHVTEKATISAERKAYVFVVTPSATKASVRASVKRLYDVEPVKVNIVNLPSKRTLVRGRHGRKPGMKKAYVYLPEGKTIELV